MAVACITADTCVPLPEHPCSSHESNRGAVICRPVVMSEYVAELLLCPLDLPCHVQLGTVYCGSAQAGAHTRPFVHTVWFSPTFAVQTGLYQTEDEFLFDIATMTSFAASCPHRAGGSSVQDAQGDYMELGSGNMAGRGRGTVTAGGWSTIRPFSRHPRVSDTLEPVLSRVLTVGSTAAHAVLPASEVSAARAHMQSLESAVPALHHAYQYPARIAGRPMVSSHQVALRKPSHESAWSTPQAEQACLHGISDLHVDSHDGLGGWELGAATLYWCLPPPDGAALCCHARGGAALRVRDLAVFPSTPRPRGARAGVMVPGWLCMLFTQTAHCPHSGICPSDMSESLQLPGLLCGKAVTYPLSAIEKLMSRCQHSPADSAVIQSTETDSRLRQRMEAVSRN